MDRVIARSTATNTSRESPCLLRHVYSYTVAFSPRVLDDAAERQGTQSGPKSAIHRHVFEPVYRLLRTGITPRQLAWSLAAGVAVGVNPVVGSTTVVCLAVAFLFRLNVVASQITNHLVFPAQLALVFPFLRAGELLFHTGPLPLERRHFLHAVTHHAWQTTRLLWMWEWHALVVWLAAAAVAVPLLAALLTPVLRRVLGRMHVEPEGVS